MLRALREIEGGVKLSLNAAGAPRQLRKPPILESFLRQVYFTGVTASTGVVLRASRLGVLIIAITHGRARRRRRHGGEDPAAGGVPRGRPARRRGGHHPAQRHGDVGRDGDDAHLGPDAGAALSRHQPLRLPGGAARRRRSWSPPSRSTFYIQFLAVAGGPAALAVHHRGDVHGARQPAVRPVHAGGLRLLDHQEPAVRLRGRGLLLLPRPQPARPDAERRAQGGDARGDPERRCWC